MLKEKNKTFGIFPDLELVKRISDEVSIPVVASGGAGNFQHIYEVIERENASAVAAVSIFHFTEMASLGARQFSLPK